MNLHLQRRQAGDNSTVLQSTIYDLQRWIELFIIINGGWVKNSVFLAEQIIYSHPKFLLNEGRAEAESASHLINSN